PAVCVACGTVFTFEMPRFGEAPAHVVLSVTHAPAGSMQHVIHLEAVSSTGRTLLACRVRAQRNLWEQADGPSRPAPWVNPVGAASEPPDPQDGNTAAVMVVALPMPEADHYASQIVATGTARPR